jgi:hypothetical protein
VIASGPPPATAAATTPTAPAAPAWKTTDEATTALVKAIAESDKPAQEAAKLYVYPHLNGMGITPTGSSGRTSSSTPARARKRSTRRGSRRTSVGATVASTCGRAAATSWRRCIS